MTVKWTIAGSVNTSLQLILVHARGLGDQKVLKRVFKICNPLNLNMALLKKYLLVQIGEFKMKCVAAAVPSNTLFNPSFSAFKRMYVSFHTYTTQAAFNVQQLYSPWGQPPPPSPDPNDHLKQHFSCQQKQHAEVRPISFILSHFNTCRTRTSHYSLPLHRHHNDINKLLTCFLCVRFCSEWRRARWGEERACEQRSGEQAWERGKRGRGLREAGGDGVKCVSGGGGENTRAKCQSVCFCVNRWK